MIFAANGFRCPLTEIAERVGAQHGSVTDIYLPRWFARNLPVIHVPVIVLAGYLHAPKLPRLVRTAGTQQMATATPSSLRIRIGNDLGHARTTSATARTSAGGRQ